MNKITIPEGLKGKEFLNSLRKQDLLLTQKKATIKHADSVTCTSNLYVNR
jgi:hypothetical protein